MKNVLYLLLSIVLFGCSTEDELIPSPSYSGYLNPDLTYGSVADCSGNTYATIEIGNQVWMAENLSTTCYANGDPITNVTDNTQWSNVTTGAWVHHSNDTTYENPYGKLYNWYAVTDPRNACPTGWHVPTDQEWTVLIDHLGGNNGAGEKMKSSGGQYWYNPYNEGTNESGFSGLPGGAHYSSGTSAELRTSGIWWSSAEHESESSPGMYNYAKTLKLVGSSSYAYESWNYKRTGYSVRCVKD